MSSSDDFQLPERLNRSGRNVDDNFDSEEKLFHRFTSMQKAEYVFYPASIRFPDFSVNREKYSEPKDVLLHEYPKYLDWGIASFKVDDIPKSEITGEGTDNETVYKFKPVHVPEDENYSHSEVRTLKNGEYSKDMSVSSKTVKLRFRIKLGKRINIERKPEN